MQQSQPYAAPTPPSPVGPPISPSRRRGPLWAALAVGLLLGGGGVGIAWALSGGGDSSGSGAAADAAAACGALDRLDESKYLAKGAAGDTALNRWAGAQVLATSAAAGDSTYKPLATAVERSRNRLAISFTVDAKVKADLAEARRICDGL